MPVTFRVIFKGKIDAGQEPNAVRSRLLQLYKGNAEAVARFFAGREVVVKDRLDRETALKYKTMFERAGVEVVIVPVAPGSLELTLEEPQVGAPCARRHEQFWSDSESGGPGRDPADLRLFGAAFLGFK